MTLELVEVLLSYFTYVSYVKLLLSLWLRVGLAVIEPIYALSFKCEDDWLLICNLSLYWLLDWVND